MKTFVTENKEYKFEFIKRKSFFNNTNIYICNITNNIGINILTFNISEIDLLNIIDNLNEFSSEDIDLYYSISNSNENIYIIEMKQLDIDPFLIYKIDDYLTKDIISINSYKDGRIIKIIQFDVSDNLNYLINLLQELYSE